MGVPQGFHTPSLSGHVSDYTCNTKTNVIPSLRGTSRMSLSLLDFVILTRKWSIISYFSITWSRYHIFPSHSTYITSPSWNRVYTQCSCTPDSFRRVPFVLYMYYSILLPMGSTTCTIFKVYLIYIFCSLDGIHRRSWRGKRNWYRFSSPRFGHLKTWNFLSSWVGNHGG